MLAEAKEQSVKNEAARLKKEAEDKAAAEAAATPPAWILRI